MFGRKQKLQLSKLKSEILQPNTRYCHDQCLLTEIIFSSHLVHTNKLKQHRPFYLSTSGFQSRFVFVLQTQRNSKQMNYFTNRRMPKTANGICQDATVLQIA